jgi:hypothetical protein
MDDDKKSGGKIEGERSKAWQLWRVGTDGSEIELVAEADTRDELRRLHKRRQDWRYKVYMPGCPANLNGE